MRSHDTRPALRAGTPLHRYGRRSVLMLCAGLAAVLGLLAGVVAVPSGAAADSGAAPVIMPAGGPQLPAPTGPYPVGTTSLHLTDHSRSDPWVPSAGPRELMVSLWYPARRPGLRRAPYLTPEESRLLFEGQGLVVDPPEVLSRTRTNAYLDAEPVRAGHRLPLVVLSPGFGWPRSSLTALAEDLASNGYVVAGIDHTYETFGTAFPDGRSRNAASATWGSTRSRSRRAGPVTSPSCSTN